MRHVNVLVLSPPPKWIALLKGNQLRFGISEIHIFQEYVCTQFICGIMMCLILFLKRNDFHRLIGIVCFKIMMMMRMMMIMMIMTIMTIPCTCVASSLIYLISCWQSPPLTLVNEMRLLLGPQCLVAMVWIRFISCCLAIPRVSWLFFLSPRATRCLKYNESEAGQRRMAVPKSLSVFSQSTVYYRMPDKCVESRIVEWLWTWPLHRPGFKVWLRLWLGVSFNHWLSSPSLSFPCMKYVWGMIILNFWSGCKTWRRNPFKAPAQSRCSVAVTYTNKVDGRYESHTFLII